MSQTSFLGVGMSQDWRDLEIWEKLFSEHPVRSLIELGTGTGGMSIFFALQCVNRNIQYVTFDNQNWNQFDTQVPRLLNFHASFKCVDLFSEETQAYIAGLFQTMPHPICIFFDNGDKPREWALYANLAVKGDFLAVHDWMSEFNPGHVGTIKATRLYEAMSFGRIAFMQTAWWEVD